MPTALEYSHSRTNWTQFRLGPHQTRAPSLSKTSKLFATDQTSPCPPPWQTNSSLSFDVLVVCPWALFLCSIFSSHRQNSYESALWNLPSPIGRPTYTEGWWFLKDPSIFTHERKEKQLMVPIKDIFGAKKTGTEKWICKDVGRRFGIRFLLCPRIENEYRNVNIFAFGYGVLSFMIKL